MRLGSAAVAMARNVGGVEIRADMKAQSSTERTVQRVREREEKENELMYKGNRR